MLASDVLSCAGQPDSALERFELARQDIVRHANTGELTDLIPPLQLEALRNRTLQRAATVGEADADADAVVKAIGEAEASVMQRAAADIITHASLLARAADAAVAASGNASEVGPAQVSDAGIALRGRWATQVNRLVVSGARPSVWQLPGRYHGGLLARPWHAERPPGEDAPWGGIAAALHGSSAGMSVAVSRAVGRVTRLLERATPSLQVEWDGLFASGVLERETECLHTASAPVAGDAAEAGPPSDRLSSTEGQWVRYSANGFWLGDKLSAAHLTGDVANSVRQWAGLNASAELVLPFACSTDAPVLCGVVAAVAAIGREEAAAAGPTDPASRARNATGSSSSLSSSSAAAVGFGVLRPLRAGYSALAPGVSIQPHHGRTNAQLKFHVGVRVPRNEAGTVPVGLTKREVEAAEARLASKAAARAGSGVLCGSTTCGVENGVDPSSDVDPWVSGSVPEEACAALRVTGPDDEEAIGRGREFVVDRWRAWGEGRVFLFDDSFQHEVRNRCQTHRVIVQLVIEHPDLTLGEEATAQPDAAKDDH
jgi:hypothetical protein